MLSKLRIVKLNDKYVVQQRYCLFFRWRGVDKRDPFRYTNWTSYLYMDKYCSHDTLEEAKKFRDSLTPRAIVIE